MSFARTRMLVIGCLAAAILAFPGVALAFDETTSTIPVWNAGNCSGCHDPWDSSVTGTGVNVRIGVHGGYTVATSKCEACHSVHRASASGVLLLPAATIKATCNTCHDGTAGGGVYGTITSRSLAVGAEHSIEATNVVPGGSANTGGSLIATTFSGSGSTMTCTDCHSPHGSSMVAPFPGERQRSAAFGLLSLQSSSRLLKQRPGGTTTATAVYGSDWCISCHQGRDSGLSTTHNHPVESASTYADAATRFNYGNVARLSAGAGASTTPTGPLATFNGGYLMPFPRTAQQTGHRPICQQCHEDTRAVGTLSAATGASGTVNPFMQNGIDGSATGDNPRFTNFPHETVGYRMLVEATTASYTDDLCLNCHPGQQLP
ncbi:MAG: cytochrome c3 family protein [Actinomycetota bacterium]|nr:cytochrome c3 family protein [Actinomycetota bacterium]